MQGKLGASVPGQAVPEELGQFPYFVDDVLLDVSGVVPVRQVQQDREPGGAFHERAYGALVPGAGDQVTLPMARYRSPGGASRSWPWEPGSAFAVAPGVCDQIKVFSGGWCHFVGLVIDSITTNHATRPSSRRRSMMLMPNSVLILLSRYQTMYSSSMLMKPSIETPAKLRLWKNSCLRRPKNPSAAALSGEQLFALMEREGKCGRGGVLRQNEDGLRLP